MNDLHYKIAASLIPGIGHRNVKKLIAYCGGPEALFKTSINSLLKIPGLGPKTAKRLNRTQVLVEAEKEIDFMEKHQINAHFYLDEQYPTRLLHCDDGPVILYQKGNANLNPKRVLSIVGSRRASNWGKGFCEDLVKELSPYELVIVSGLAYGIDAAAHRSALKHQVETWAVLADHLDQVYPKMHSKLADKINEKGCCLSDYSSDKKLIPSHFAERNRIVAGLSDAVLVIESGKKGGSLITADLAQGYNRDVFAVPGHPKEDNAEGCNGLIKNNKAALIESAEDVILALGWEEQIQKKTQIQIDFNGLNEDQKAIMNCFVSNPVLGIDTICLNTNQSMSKTNSLLLELEFLGCLQSLPGKQFQVI